MGVFGIFVRVDVDDGKLFYKIRINDILLRKIRTQGYSPKLKTLANTFFIVVYISSTDTFGSVICLFPITSFSVSFSPIGTKVHEKNLSLFDTRPIFL